jgi:NSS family neurotransmitter:Na+ symporter
MNKTTAENVRLSAFSSRLGLFLSVLGIAIGTGNIWRFPRIAASSAGPEGAGAFLLVWVLFLFLWSLPLIVAEYALGRLTGKSVITSFTRVGGEKQTWKGGFVVVVAVAIMAYYGVITGWCWRYFGMAVTFSLPETYEAAQTSWNLFQSGWMPMVFQAAVFVVAGIVVSGGIRWIERISLVMVPALVLVMVVMLIRAVTLPGSFNGIKYLFAFNASDLWNYRIWMEALTQNAWDTGAGWGLILSYAAFAGSKDQIVKNAFRTGISNNLMSIIAGITIFATVFSTLSLSGYDQNGIANVLKEGGPASTGLTFMWMPVLFAEIPGGTFLSIIFFGGLSMAAFTSFISMVQLGSRTLIELDFHPKKGLWALISIAFFAGAFSATDVNVLANQDFVWGLGLMVSGLFIAGIIVKYGADKFATEAINTVAEDIKAGTFWIISMKFLVPLQALILLGWWFYRSIYEFTPDAWLNPLVSYSLANVLMYWGIAMIVLFAVNKWLANKTNHA